VIKLVDDISHFSRLFVTRKQTRVSSSFHMPPKKTKSGSKSKPSEESENASDSEEEVTELEFADAAPILEVGTVLSDTLSERFRLLFPSSRGVGPYAWPAKSAEDWRCTPTFRQRLNQTHR
jgi:hypothetical protein